MSRVMYFLWVLLALVVFIAMMLFVLANDEPQRLDLLVPGWAITLPGGVLALACFAVGAGLGLLVGMGVSLVRRTARPGDPGE
jgi:uncharacterized integral membrane protein